MFNIKKIRNIYFSFCDGEESDQLERTAETNFGLASKPMDAEDRIEQQFKQWLEKFVWSANFDNQHT